MECNPLQGIVCKNGDSTLWKDIVKWWPKILCNTGFIVGDETKIHFWKDEWMEQGVKLETFASPLVTNEDLERNLNWYVKDDGKWNIRELNHVLPDNMIAKLSNFLPPKSTDGVDDLFGDPTLKVVSLVARAIDDLVTGEIMQMSTTADQRYSMEYYMQKTYYKTASLISNSCKAVAVLAGQTAEIAMLAFDYGKNLGLAFQLIDDVLDFTGTSASLGKGFLSDIRHGIVTAPILFAMEEFPQLRAVVDKGFDNPDNVDIALEYLGKSRGIQRTKDLAVMHTNLAVAAIDSLPDSDDEEVKKSRRALVNLTQRVIVSH
ncbi:hypothetical protein Ahy_A07g033745 [Arachis hypogaea]|uniref:Uncharacterized protein n=1 Tax=Arachis hypogaea TaxID=3818 RepID=A0A445CA08_ARAHY|nr:hypothetical protein Ahy_A07g033745 [Arachis hypogaea]